MDEQLAQLPDVEKRQAGALEGGQRLEPGVPGDGRHGRPGSGPVSEPPRGTPAPEREQDHEQDGDEPAASTARRSLTDGGPATGLRHGMEHGL